MSNQKRADQMLDDAIQKALQPRSSSIPPSPELEPFCKNCGGIRSAHIEEMTGSLRCLPGRDSWFRARVDAPPPPSLTQEWRCMECRKKYIGSLSDPKCPFCATPSSPETAELTLYPCRPPSWVHEDFIVDETPDRAELTEALDELVTWAERKVYADLSGGTNLIKDAIKNRDAARAALESMYTRQREEIDQWEASALTNLGNYKAANDYAESLSSQLERLKADSRKMVNWICGESPGLEATNEVLRLARRLSSDSGTRGENEAR